MIAPDTLRPAIERLAEDGFLAYPTETVWGLGACADRPRAIGRLLEWKARGPEAPMSILVSSPEAADALGCVVEGHAKRLVDVFWPGPLTVVVPCTRDLVPGVRSAEGTVGLRCSPHPVARALAEAVDAAGLAPLTSTSMNRRGEPPARDLASARALVDAGRAEDPSEPLIVTDSGHDAGGGAPSSVVDCSGATPQVLRVGAIDRARLEKIWSCEQSPRSGEKIQ